MGYLTVGLSQELSDIVVVKSDSDEIIYSLDVYDSEGNVDFHTDDHTSVSEESPIELLMGKYDVVALYGEDGTAFNKPAYGGQNSVRIYPDRSTSVDIQSTMKKVMVTVSFPEDQNFVNAFTSYEFMVTDGQTPLTFSNNPEAGNSAEGSFNDVAYFEVPQDRTLTYRLQLINADNRHYTITDQITGVSAAQHYHFDFKLGEREDIAGALVVNVSLDGEYKDEFVHKLNLNFDKTGMPSYSHNAEFDPTPEGAIPVYPLGNDILKKLTFSAPRGIKNLIISHLDVNLLEQGLPQLTDFVNISAADHKIMTDLGIHASAVEKGAEVAEIDITEYIKNLLITPDNETYLISFTVIDTYERYARCDFEFTIVSDIAAETVSAAPWSSFATLKGRYFSKVAPSGMTFQYKKVNDSEWTEIDASKITIDEASMTYSCLLNHLDLNTDYVFRSTSDKDKQDGKTSSEVRFRTYATEGQPKNMSLDAWYDEGEAYYPNASSSSSDWVWDTANGGTKTLGYYPTNPESTIVAVSGNNKRAAKMVSVYASVKFAAGNIYTGKFASINLGQMGAELDWGYSFDSRPLALKGWYRYEPAKVNYTSKGYEKYSGQDDMCHIQAFLTDWTGKFRIKAYQSGSEFVDFTADYILAHGELVDDKNTVNMDHPDKVNGYIPFLIPIQYRSLAQPSYIVISAASSRYGDYFTGGEGSTLYIDELELVYDPEQLTAEEFELVMKGIR